MKKGLLFTLLISMFMVPTTIVQGADAGNLLEESKITMGW